MKQIITSWSRRYVRVSCKHIAVDSKLNGSGIRFWLSRTISPSNFTYMELSDKRSVCNNLPILTTIKPFVGYSWEDAFVVNFAECWGLNQRWNVPLSSDDIMILSAAGSHYSLAIYVKQSIDTVLLLCIHKVLMRALLMERFLWQTICCFVRRSWLVSHSAGEI